MKYLLTLLFVLSVSFVSAQESNSTKKNDVITIDSHTNELNSADSKSVMGLVISVKGIKKIEDIDIENFNKRTYLNLMTSNKRKNITC